MTSSIAYRHKHALIIGINKYPRDPLNYCLNDAEDLTTALERINFQVTSSTDCNLDGFYRVINEFVKRIQRDDLVLFYFAGHGKQNNDENYLFPSDYDYHHRGDERDYIPNHAVNVKHIMKEIDDKCRIVIYLFDCCRNLLRTREPNANQGLLPMSTTARGLIVYACAPGKAVLDETRNDRNGSFMENLLKYITIPSRDIKEIIENVARDVDAQTAGFQSPQYISSLRGKVFLVDNNQDSDEPYTTHHILSARIPNQPSFNTVATSSTQSLKEMGAHRTLAPLKNVPPKRRSLPRLYEHEKSAYSNAAILPAASLQITSVFTERSKWPFSLSNDTDSNRGNSQRAAHVELPVHNTERTTTTRQQPTVAVGTCSIPDIGGSNCRHLANRDQMTEFTDLASARKPSDRKPLKPSIDVTVTKPSANNNKQQQRQTARSTATTDNSVYNKYFRNDDGDDDDDDDEEGNASKESVPMTDTHNVEAPVGGRPTFLKKTVKIADCLKPDDQSTKQLPDGIDKSNNDRPSSSSIQTPTTHSETIDRTEYDDHSRNITMDAKRSRDLIVSVQSLKVRYELHIPSNSTIEHLKNIIWQKININVERCQKESHILLLFTHRMHIFLSEEAELVSEFMKLTPSEPHFYFYALKRYQQSNEMYTYETKISDLFSSNTDWWTPVHFIEDAQLPRPQSVLLSSLYALRLFFYKINDELTMWRQVMEAQFFIHLRKYLFPPAVLALKHAMEGALFWFEKPLIVDSLLQLLTLLCPPKIKRNELCDCIPLLFCWLLELCDPTATDSDFYQLVALVHSKSGEKHYFDDPTTAVNANPVPLIMREREKSCIDAIRHVDLRSFTRYMQNKSHYANITSCKCDDYLIYDPPKGTRVPSAAISHLTDDQVKQLYETMARKYQPFMLITRGALRSDINDQLVLMQDRTVALMFTRKINKRPATGSSTRAGTVEHVFEIFNPLQHTVGKRQYVGSDQLYQLGKNGTQDPYLPKHLLLNACEVPHTGSVHDPNVSAPIQQITVVALDISRSMFEKPASPDANDYKTVFDMSIIMLGTMCDNIVFGRCAHDVGLIHFGTSVEVICPITRNRNDFEKALSIEPKRQEWTSMYDALNKAITLIRTHEQDRNNSIAKDCKKLIICISDGIENHSSTTIDQLGDRLKNYNIVVDFVSFLRDDLLKVTEKDKVCSFRQLCNKTHGYVYQNLPLTNIELGATFEQEAAVWLCEREPKSFGPVNKPVRRMPAQLHQKATHQVPGQFAQNIQDASNYTRVLREANNAIKTEMDNINVYVCRSDIFFWKIILSGPFGTPYEGGRWMLYVHFGPQYPRQPPSIRFVTEIYHVNVSGDGRVCHHLFDRGWGNNTAMTEVFESILQLLQEPNFDDAVSTEKAQLKRDQPNEYDRQAKECTQRYGNKSLDQLKKDFELEDC